MAVTTPTVRLATLSDLGALLPLVRGYREFYRQQHDAEGERVFIERHLRNASSRIYIAEAGGVPVAFMQIFKTYSTVHLGCVWVLEDLFVDLKHRHSGIGTALLKRALSDAREDKASGMFLETAHDNVAAQGVYEKAGWVREGRFIKYNAPLA
jgi:ribosomal protein S18 acetylase RimI-like enzyme